MDEITIGKFLANERKKKEYTQKQLADVLGVSDKTISKWETGKSIPDISMLNVLCKTLNISINEFVTGEKISDEEYVLKSEENIEKLLLENENSKKRNNWYSVIGIAVMVVSLALLVVSLFGSDFTKIRWYTDILTIFIFIGIFVAVIMLCKSKKTKVKVIGKCIIPIGMILSIINLISVLNMSTSTEHLLKNISVSLLPMLYGFILYIIYHFIYTE